MLKAPLRVDSTRSGAFLVRRPCALSVGRVSTGSTTDAVYGDPPPLVEQRRLRRVVETPRANPRTAEGRPVESTLYIAGRAAL